MKNKTPPRLRPWIISAADFRRYPSRALAACASGRVIFVRSANRRKLCLLVPLNDPGSAQAAITPLVRDRCRVTSLEDPTIDWKFLYASAAAAARVETCSRAP